MDEGKFLALLKYARAHSYLGLRIDYWHGYQRGLRRGFQGEMFGSDADHEEWMRLADEGADEASRERGRGYRDGLDAIAAAFKRRLGDSTRNHRKNQPPRGSGASSSSNE
jgi:hypothetical protein